MAIKLCRSGFHFCKTLREVLQYYGFINGHRFCEIEATGEIVVGEDKCVTNQIKIVREIEITDVLNMLSKDKEWNVREAVARNLNTTTEDLKILAKDGIDVVRYEVAKHQNTSAEDLKILAKDKEFWIRCKVAMNQNIDTETLKKLAKDENECARYSAMLNLKNREEN